MFKTEEKVCIALSGAFFDKDFLKAFLIETLGQAIAAVCEEDTFKMFEAYLEIIEFKAPYGELFMLDANSFKESKDSTKWFIGIHIRHLPERMSMKRFNIDIREMLTKCRLIDESEPDMDRVKCLFDTGSFKH